MAIKTKPIADVAAKWAEVTPTRSRYYEAGVRSPREDWAQNTQAAAPIYRAAVSDPNIERVFAGGVRRSGTPKWQRKSIDVGVGRFGPGVQAARGDFQEGFAPILEAIAGVTLPAAGPRGDDRNYERVRAVGNAAHLRRLALRAAGS